MAKQPRRKIVVDRRFQLQYLHIWLAVAVGLVVISVGFYFLSKGVSGGLSRIDPTFVRLMIGMSVFVILFSLLMGLLSVVMTHRVAGAAWRLDQCIRRLSGGDLDVRITLRKGDYLHNLADSLNELRETMKRSREAARELLGLLEEAQASPDGEEGKKIADLCDRLRAFATGKGAPQEEQSDAPGG